jgi:hypothetical protein
MEKPPRPDSPLDSPPAKNKLCRMAEVFDQIPAEQSSS